MASKTLRAYQLGFPNGHVFDLFYNCEQLGNAEQRRYGFTINEAHDHARLNGFTRIVVISNTGSKSYQTIKQGDHHG